MQPYSIPADAHVGVVYLTTANLPRLLDFYQSVIGLKLLNQGGDRAWLGTDAGRPLLVLTERPEAPPRAPRTTGLYHVALLTPSRFHLACALRHIAETGYPLQGASDHLVSEAVYLADPDGNGIEVYADRPRVRWPRRNGQVELATVPLNVDDLMAELSDDPAWGGLPDGTCVGHIHLQVGDLQAAEAFYQHGLGFDVITRYGPSASFLAAGGYHHHIGLNTWTTAGAPPSSADAVGLSGFSIELPDETTRRELLLHLQALEIPFGELDDDVLLRDTSNNAILLTVAPSVEPVDHSPLQPDQQG